MATVNRMATAQKKKLKTFRTAYSYFRLSQSSEQEIKTKRISQISSSSSGSCPTGTTRPPPPPERIDSLTGRAEEGELRAAPWFQAGIPRYALFLFRPTYLRSDRDAFSFQKFNAFFFLGK